MAEGGEEEDGPGPELCDVCGAVIADATEHYAFVRDSSATHRHDPRLDRRRMVAGCSPERLEQLIEQYKRWPFVEAEWWAGRIARSLYWHFGKVTEKELVTETGLSPEQIERALTWHNLEAERWRQRFGGWKHGSEGEQ